MSGKIVNLAIGNTEVIAKYIQELTGGELFKINPTNAYPNDYTEATEIARKELDEGTKPELSAKIEKINSYDVIFLGYPIWWSTFPAPVRTFLSEYDLTGKTIIPFCTHEGSAMGKSVSDIKKLCPNANVLDGLAIRGSKVNDVQKDVSKWLNELGILS